MNLAHIHLLLNHFPTVGMIIGLGLFLLALLGKSEDLKEASLVIFVGLAFISIPTYVTGSAALEQVRQMPEISKTAANTHLNAALSALVIMELLGIFAWLGLWQHRRFSRVANWNIVVVLILAVATLGAMGRAANIGGEIRHPEVMDGPETPDTGLLKGSEVAAAVLQNPWVWPACETLHFIGLCLLLGMVFLLDLRMLGIMKNVAFPALHRLLPWAILGFAINVATGMLFFVAAPEQYTANIAFHWKLGLILLGGANALYFTLFDEAWTLKPGDDAPLMAKALAMSALILWVGVMYFGSMLPFIGNAF